VNTKLSGFRNLYPFRSTDARTDFTTDPAGARSAQGQLSQVGNSRNQGGGGYGQLELTYDPSPLHSFTLSGNGNLYRSSSPQTLFNQYQDFRTRLPGQLSRDTLYSRDISQRYEGRNYDLNAGYTRTFGEAQPRREWSVLAQHTRNRGNQNYALDQYRAADVLGGPLEYREQSFNLSRNLETTVQTDYTQPLPDSSAVEMGLKTIRRQVTSNYSLDTLLLSRQPDFARSARRSNAFDYRQNVLAAYATYNFSAGKKYSFSLGTRLEHTAIEGEFSSQDSRFRNSYLNVLPNVSATRNLKKPGQTVRLSYSRRIQRPQIYYLNPYVNQITANAIRFGNPSLSPETTDALELSYGTFGEKTSLNASAFVRRTGNAIEEVNRYNTDLARSETTFANIATNTSYGLSLYGSLKPTAALSFSSNLEPTYTRIYSAALNRTSSRLNAYINLNTSYKFAKVYTAQAFGGIWTGDVQLQTRNSGGYYYVVGLKRMLLADKADITLNSGNFLTRGLAFRSTTTTDQFTTSNSFFQYRRSVRLSFNYRFGKVDAGGGRQRRTIQNDDSKQGSSKGGG
jgi:ferric enterobactin receptor